MAAAGSGAPAGSERAAVRTDSVSPGSAAARAALRSRVRRRQSRPCGPTERRTTEPQAWYASCRSRKRRRPRKPRQQRWRLIAALAVGLTYLYAGEFGDGCGRPLGDAASLPLGDAAGIPLAPARCEPTSGAARYISVYI